MTSVCPCRKVEKVLTEGMGRGSMENTAVLELAHPPFAASGANLAQMDAMSAGAFKSHFSPAYAVSQPNVSIQAHLHYKASTDIDFDSMHPSSSKTKLKMSWIDIPAGRSDRALCVALSPMRRAAALCPSSASVTSWPRCWQHSSIMSSTRSSRGPAKPGTPRSRSSRQGSEDPAALSAPNAGTSRRRACAAKYLVDMVVETRGAGQIMLMTVATSLSYPSQLAHKCHIQYQVLRGHETAELYLNP